MGLLRGSGLIDGILNVLSNWILHSSFSIICVDGMVGTSAARCQMANEIIGRIRIVEQLPGTQHRLFLHNYCHMFAIRQCADSETEND